MQFETVKAAVIGVAAAIVSSLCCLLPLLVVLLGLGSGAFMMVTMQYRALYLPVGVLGVGLGHYFYYQKKRRCLSTSYAFDGGTLNLVLLSAATVMVALALTLEFFPQLSSDILQMVM
jgi:hypothetical protein